MTMGPKEISLIAMDNTNGNTCTGMFSGCTSLVEAPEIKATTARDYCCDAMFYGCTAMTKTQETLYMTVISGTNVFHNMFCNCKSLVKGPEIIVSEFKNGMYGNNNTYTFQYMFAGCTSMTGATASLPALDLSPSANCYEGMFSGCTSLVNPPELPATILSKYCYRQMFAGCTSMKKSPDLMVTSVTASDAYASMFSGCTSLNYIKCMAVNQDQYPIVMSGWVIGVSSTRTFVKSPSATWATGVAGIPNNWTVEDA